jgi:hypothetical protein
MKRRAPLDWQFPRFIDLYRSPCPEPPGFDCLTPDDIKTENINSSLAQWPAYNLSEVQSTQLLLPQFDDLIRYLHQLSDQILLYQMHHNVSLKDQEHRLLKEFEYPFIDIKTDNYSPEDLETFRFSRYQSTFPHSLQLLIDQNPFPVSNLSTISTPTLDLVVIAQNSIPVDIPDFDSPPPALTTNTPVNRYYPFIIFDQPQNTNPTTTLIMPNSDLVHDLQNFLHDDPKAIRLTLQYTGETIASTAPYTITSWQPVNILR